MTFAVDLSHLDHKYRARRTGQTPIEYAASIEVYKRPRRQWGAYIITAALLAGAAMMAKM